MNAFPNKALAEVIKLLDMKQLNDTTFAGAQYRFNEHRIYGGQVVSQALMAACACVEEGRPVISLKSDFLRAGDPRQDVLFQVENVRDGRSFNTRRVTAIQEQKGKQQIIFTLSATFQKDEQGVEHQIDMSSYPAPEELPEPREHWEKIKDSLPQHARQWYDIDRAFEERAVVFNNPVEPVKREPYYAVWFRANGNPGDNSYLHQGLFAYVSDMCLLDTCVLPHGISWMQPNFQSASLDHCIWYHRPFRVDQWLLFVCDSPAAFGGRGFNRALVYTQDGKLVASVTQEGLIRVHKK